MILDDFPFGGLVVLIENSAVAIGNSGAVCLANTSGGRAIGPRERELLRVFDGLPVRLQTYLLDYAYTLSERDNIRR